MCLSFSFLDLVDRSRDVTDPRKAHLHCQKLWKYSFNTIPWKDIKCAYPVLISAREGLTSIHVLLLKYPFLMQLIPIHRHLPCSICSKYSGSTDLLAPLTKTTPHFSRTQMYHLSGDHLKRQLSNHTSGAA